MEIYDIRILWFLELQDVSFVKFGNIWRELDKWPSIMLVLTNLREMNALLCCGILSSDIFIEPSFIVLNWNSLTCILFIRHYLEIDFVFYSSNNLFCSVVSYHFWEEFNSVGIFLDHWDRLGRSEWSCTSTLLRVTLVHLDWKSECAHISTFRNFKFNMLFSLAVECQVLASAIRQSNRANTECNRRPMW